MHLKKIALLNFCGFKTFESDVLPFTVFVGPNNRGKTTLLRAIKFAMDAFRIHLGDQLEPHLNQLRNDGRMALSGVGQRAGIADLSQFYFGRHQNADSTVTLTFDHPNGDVSLTATCLSDQNHLRLGLFQQGANLFGGNVETEKSVATDVFKKRIQFIAPLGTTSPSERELSYPALQTEMGEGRYAETWRNQLHWLNDGQPPEFFQRAAQAVHDYLPDVKVRPPRRTKIHNPPQVIVDYIENGIEHDIAAAGGGLRTLISLTTAIELSGASILLFDEPDSHLHSLLQRQVANLLLALPGPDRQVIISTHSPDVIDCVPTEVLRWVDRMEEQSKSCDSVGKVLVS